MASIRQALALIAVGAACLAGSGCTEGPCIGDPRTDGLRCASTAIRTGTYDRQNASLAQELAARRSELARARGSVAATGAELQQARELRVELEAKLSDLLLRIEQAKAKRSDLSAQLDALSEKVKQRLEMVQKASPDELRDETSPWQDLDDELDEIVGNSLVTNT